MKKVLLIILLMGVTYMVNADGKLNTEYVNTIFSSEQHAQWLKVINKGSLTIFNILWAMETFKECLTNKFFDFVKAKELFRFLAVRILFMVVWSAILMKPELYLGIIQLFTKIAKDGVIDLIPDGKSVGGITHLDAGWVWHQFAMWFSNDVPVIEKSIGWSPISMIAIGILEIIYFLCTLVISFLIIMLEIETTCIVFGALILTSFAGSSWTKQYWDRYLSMVVGMGLHIMLFCFLYAGLQNKLTYHPGQSSIVTDVLGIDIWTQIANCILCTLALWIIPGKIAGAISSASGGGTGGAAIQGFFAGIAVAKTAGAIAMNGVKGGMTILNKSESLSGGGKTTSEYFKSGGSSPQPSANSVDKANFLNNKSKSE